MKGGKGKRILACTVVCSVLATGFCGCGVVNAKLEYQLSADGKSYAVVDCESLFKREVKIPETYNGLPVTTIGASAFAWCDTLTGIVLPDSITAIEKNAFAFCCELTSVRIGSSITQIQDSAFEGCTRLTGIEVASDNGFYTSVEGNLYSKNKERILQYATGKSEKQFVLPDSVKRIGATAFAWCESLENVVMSDSVTIIEEAAFYWCDGLQNITLPNSVTEIGDSAFSWCERLSSVTVGSDVRRIGKEVFLHSENLKAVTFEDTKGWFCTSDKGYTGGQTVDVSQAAQNADGFLNKHIGAYFYKIDG